MKRKWGNGEAKGKIAKVCIQKITRKIDGAEVTRDADNDCPAYFIRQTDGDGEVLKLHSEISKIS